MRKYLFISMLLFSILSLKAQYVTNGSASHISGGEYQLTPQNYYQGGSVWYQVRLDLRYDFDIMTQMNFGQLDGGGADGMAFVLQPLNVNQGAFGGGIGYMGINPSLAVEFDTWWNPENNDAVNDHLAFMKNGNTVHTGGAIYQFGNIEDNAWHDAHFQWNASAQTLTVGFLGNTYVLSEDIINTIFAGNPYVYWGFTGATGAAINDQRVRIGTTSFVEEMTIHGDVSPSSCPSSSDGSVVLTVTGGISPYTYLWSNGATSKDLTNVPAGNYSVQVTDAAGVVKNESFIVGTSPDNTPPTFTCPQSPVTKCFSNQGTYSIDPANVQDNCSAVTVSYTVTGATSRSGNGNDASGHFETGSSTITWTATDASGNTSSCSVVVNINLEINVTIPDVYAVNPGGLANTIYIGYGPASITLNAGASGGSGGFTYQWQDGSTGSSIIANPSIPGSYIYAVTVTDAAGCTASASKTVYITDVRCGNKMDKVTVCHVPAGNPENAHAICIAPAAVGVHLAHGDMLGACPASLGPVRKNIARDFEEETDMAIKVAPNPNRGQFNLMIRPSGGGVASISIVNAQGMVVSQKQLVLKTSQVIPFDMSKLASGVYLVRLNMNGHTETSTFILKK